jgi:hypothetical protein
LGFLYLWPLPLICRTPHHFFLSSAEQLLLLSNNRDNYNNKTFLTATGTYITHWWVGNILLDGLAGFNEGTTLTRFGELIFKFMIWLDVEIFNPCTTQEKMVWNKEITWTGSLSYKLSVPKKKTQEAVLPGGLEIRFKSLGGLAIWSKNCY